MADDLGAVIRALATALGGDADAIAIADALWLAAAPRAVRAEPGGGSSAPSPGEQAALPPQEDARTVDAPTASSSSPADADPVELYERLPRARPVDGTSVDVPVGRDLDRAMEMGRALRPFKRRFPRGRRSGLDLDVTIRDFSRTGELIPVLAPIPEPWFEVLLVVDTSPSMAVWASTTAEFASLLAGLGAFRHVRTWGLRGGSNPTVTDHQGRNVAPGQVASSDGRRLVLMLSDCASPGWREPEVWQLLRRWGAATPVALLNPLPSRLWHRTGLDLPAIRVTRNRPSPRNADLVFTVPLLLRMLSGAEDPDWQALPTLAFSPHSLARWARTFMRGAPQGCDAVLVPRSGVLAGSLRVPRDERFDGPDPTTAFLRTASPSAVRLASLCSPFSRLSLPLMRLIRRQLVPQAAIGDLAELLTSPLVRIESPDDGPPVITFDDVSRDRLASGLSRRDAWRTHDVLSRHIEARSPVGRDVIRATAVSDPESVPAHLRPFARASRELLGLLKGGEREPSVRVISTMVRAAPIIVQPMLVRAAPITVRPSIPHVSVPAGEPSVSDEAPTGPRLPDPRRSSAVLIGVSDYADQPLHGVDADLAAMRFFLTSPEGWGMPEARCVTLDNPVAEREVLEAVQKACQSDDTVLLYFAGHGTVHDDQVLWLLGGEATPRTEQAVNVGRVIDIIAASRAAHVMVLLDHCATAAETMFPRSRPGVEVVSTEYAADSPEGGDLTQNLLRVATGGVPGAAAFLDLATIVQHMRPLEGKSARNRTEARHLASGSSSIAFARNRAWQPPITSPEPAVTAVCESVAERLHRALPYTYTGRYRAEVDRLLLALVTFVAESLDATEPVDSEMQLSSAAAEFLARRGIVVGRDERVADRRVDIVWRSEAGVLAVHVVSAADLGDGWTPVSSVDFQLVLDDRHQSAAPELANCVSFARPVEDDPWGGEQPCSVVMRLPLRQPPFDVEPADDEREVDDQFAAEETFMRFTLPAAVESACESLVGSESELDGLDLELLDVTISQVSARPESILWDIVEDYEYGPVLAQVTVEATVTYEAAMNRRDFYRSEQEFPLVGEINEHVVLVGVERERYLLFEARRESYDSVELEFSGTNEAEPHPHDPR